jgi:hypothetical protein
MPLSKNLRRERSQTISLQTVTFNAPGIYYPPYGKSVFLLSGRGTPGNATIPGNADGGNNSTLYYYYEPASGGNYAGTNPAVPGNYAGTNPTVPGNSGTNPSTPGNQVKVLNVNSTSYVYDNTGSTPYATYTYNFDFPIDFAVYGDINLSPDSSAGNSGNSYVVTYTNYSYARTYFNSATPGNAYTNPATPGNAFNNPSTPAADYYNPYVAASTPAAYNAGNPNYNPTVSGTAGANYAVLGIPLPGGAIGSAAPVVGYSTITVAYSNSGVPISVPPGGYVAIQNKRPGT